MKQGAASVAEVFLERDGAAARLTCGPGLVPGPGQYLHARAPAEPDAPLATALFPAGYTADGFLAAAPWPSGWSPGERLLVRGPLGRGFALPPSARRVALAAAGPSPARLLPLIDAALAQGAALALIAAAPPAGLPAAVEVMPLAALPEARRWAEFLALDVPRERLEGLAGLLGLRPEEPWPAGAQALIGTPMPCMGIGTCGVCAVPGARAARLACVDGPVFPLSELRRRE